MAALASRLEGTTISAAEVFTLSSRSLEIGFELSTDVGDTSSGYNPDSGL